MQSVKDALSGLGPALEGVDHSALITNSIFQILRTAEAVRADVKPNIAVCWGGHSITKPEYDYAYKVGRALGLRGIDALALWKPQCAAR